MEKKEELALKYATDAFIDRQWILQARFLDIENIFAKKHIKKAYIEGWDSALRNLWTIPTSRETTPKITEIKEKGFIALLSDGSVRYQKDLKGFYWESDDNKFVYLYKEVVAWMYAPTVEEVLGK